MRKYAFYLAFALAAIGFLAFGASTDRKKETHQEVEKILDHAVNDENSKEATKAERKGGAIILKP